MAFFGGQNILRRGRIHEYLNESKEVIEYFYFKKSYICCSLFVITEINMFFIELFPKQWYRQNLPVDADYFFF